MNRFVARAVRALAGAGIAGLLALVLHLIPTPSLAAQAEGLASQSLRGYWHVFAAYAVAWLLLLGWLVAVFRRLGRLDRETNAG